MGGANSRVQNLGVVLWHGLRSLIFNINVMKLQCIYYLLWYEVANLFNLFISYFKLQTTNWLILKEHIFILFFTYCTIFIMWWTFVLFKFVTWYAVLRLKTMFYSLLLSSFFVKSLLICLYCTVMSYYVMCIVNFEINNFFKKTTDFYVNSQVSLQFPLWNKTSDNLLGEHSVRI